ncbi:MAG: hypothetical protein ACR2LR_17040 [Hassallia sp.]
MPERDRFSTLTILCHIKHNFQIYIGHGALDFVNAPYLTTSVRNPN